MRFPTLLLISLSLIVGSAIGAFVVSMYFPRIEVREIIKELPQPDIPPCLYDTDGPKG